MILMRFSPAFLDEIRARVPISDVVGRRVTWDRRKTQPSRGDWWACCPFHGEKSPSFHCEDAKGRYHCFGCGVSGDHFRFMVELEGMSFPEAVERLAGEAGVPMPARDADAERRERERATLSDAVRLAAEFFRQTLQEADGAKARSYLRDRGLHPVTQKTFGLGYAPDSRNRLKQFLADRGIGKAEIEGAGLVVHGEGIAVSYDRFRDRVMFPILDGRESAIAFGGRALSADTPAKYLNSPETELFHKGNVLYNLAQARRASKASNTLVVAEGYMDVIALHQAGIENAVAPLGTALTQNQLELLWRTAPEPILCFDGDAAGIKAANRAADLALPHLKPGRSLRFALLPDGKDPDDLIRSGGADAMRAVLERARPLADLIWTRESGGGGFDTPERRAELEQRLKTTLRQIGDESLRRHYLQDAEERLSAFFGVAKATQGFGRGGERGPREGRTGRRGGGGEGGRPAFSRNPTGSAGLQRGSDRLTRTKMVGAAHGSQAYQREASIVVGFVNHPALLREAFDYFADLELTDGEMERVRSAVVDVYADDQPHSRDDILSELDRRGMGDTFARLEGVLRLVRLWPVLPEAALEDAREAVRQALHLQHRAISLNKELKAAEDALARGDDDFALAQVVEINREINNLAGTEALIDGFGVLSGRPAKGI
ncbi:DNA primase [Aureimonas jatrophae]|uniref:DNA primase n=2 Tax=Aureimonas jatrophae TaxID=1166073 RepID=A0A1H0LHI5_9HYPH|nr:DNA primase [Aureimonas jatrophae]